MPLLLACRYQTARGTRVASMGIGGVAERTIASVLKTVEGQPSGGSNPPPSAT